MNFIMFMNQWLKKTKSVAKFLRSATLEDDGYLRYLFSFYDESIYLLVKPLNDGTVSYYFLENSGVFNTDCKDTDTLETPARSDDVQNNDALGFSQITSDYSVISRAIVSRFDSFEKNKITHRSMTTSRMIGKAVLNGTAIKVMDVGASPINDPPYLNLKNIGYVDVIGFEPNFEEYKNIKVTGGDLYYNVAIGDGEAHNLHITSSPGFTSILEIDLEKIRYLNRWQRNVHVEKVIKVNTIRLSTLTDLPHIDLLKMDIQGAEGMVLQNAKEVLETAVCVIVEVSMLDIYKSPVAHFSSIHDILLNSGYIFHKFLFLKSHALRPISEDFEDLAFPPSQVIDGDAVYIKDPSNTRFHNVCTLGKLALISDAVINSPDLALRCLELISGQSDKHRSVAKDYVRLFQAWSNRNIKE